MRKVYKAKPQFVRNTSGFPIFDLDTPKDPNGKSTVRSESKPFGFDIVFAGAGDEMGGGLEIGGGTPFFFDFDDPTQLVDAPVGHKRVRVDWQFNDRIYIKEGTVYYYNMPKGAYVDMYIVCPAGGYPYGYRVHGRPQERNQEVLFNVTGAEEVIVSHWINRNRMEGTVPMGDEFNTESAGEQAPPPYFIWRAEVTVPELANEAWKECHGHWTLEIYRPSSIYFPDPT